MQLLGFCRIYCYSQELLIFLMLGINSMTQEGKGIVSVVPDWLWYYPLCPCHLESLWKEWTLFWIASVGTIPEKVSAFSSPWEPTFYMVSAEQ